MKKKIFILFLIILSFGLMACELRVEERNSDESFVDYQDVAELNNIEKHELDDYEHEHSVEIEGKDMRMLTVQEIADLWKIDSEDLLFAIISKFNLTQDYTVNTLLDVLRQECKFSPSLVKDLAEDLKTVS